MRNALHFEHMEVPLLEERLLALIDIGELVNELHGFLPDPLGVHFILAVFIKLVGHDHRHRLSVVVHSVVTGREAIKAK